MSKNVRTKDSFKPISPIWGCLEFFERPKSVLNRKKKVTT